MKPIWKGLLQLMVGGSILLQPTLAKDVTCKSDNYRYKFCEADTRGGVKLDKVQSNAPCIYGKSWGFNSQGVWVDEGCAARFKLGEGGEVEPEVAWTDLERRRQIALCQYSVREKLLQELGGLAAVTFQSGDLVQAEGSGAEVRGLGSAKKDFRADASQDFTYRCTADVRRDRVADAEFRWRTAERDGRGGREIQDVALSAVQEEIRRDLGRSVEVDFQRVEVYSIGTFQEGVRGSGRLRNRRNWEPFLFDVVVNNRRMRAERVEWDFHGDSSWSQVGRLIWSGRVDDEVDLVIERDRVEVREISGKRTDRIRFEFAQPLPRREVRAQVRKLDGRGEVTIRQQPTRANGYRLVVTVRDKKGGADDYELEIKWE